MWTIKIRYGAAELITLASLLAVAGLLTLAFFNEWTIALVPGLTYALAVLVTYGAYRRYAGERLRAAEPVPMAAFRVVGGRGECPLGLRKGDLVTVGAGGAVAPALCSAAVAVLRLASADGEADVKEWCCPVYEHQLVFRQEAKAA